ncbi:unnamed protein product [Psylliodes chrysocephalus]|uniref:TAF6 C-terminal HEAT repeat domain-containing protein n=1 Tax=Psylliodes chrysocephalus TaxID=3402493 RepID=A0A9P0D8R2_9CUCU|nr:unnamed protein product [Psylliodes chrysocephala]
MSIVQKFVPKVDTVFLKVFPDNHPLSVEEQIFYLTLTEGIFGYNEQVRNENLKILATDYNINSLLPYLSIFIKQAIHVNIAHPDLTLLIYSVRMVKSLLNNQYLNIVEHLHDLIPAVLSCVLARRISKCYYDNHWTLRDFSVFVISAICEKYNNRLNNITNRVIGIYLRPLKAYSMNPLTTIYGAIKGLGCLGEEVVKTFLFPRISGIGKLLFILLERQTHNFYVEELNDQMILEAKHVRDAILNIVAPILLKTKNTNDGGMLYSQYFGYLGNLLYTEVKNLEKIEFEKQKSITYY